MQYLICVVHRQGNSSSTSEVEHLQIDLLFLSLYQLKTKQGKIEDHFFAHRNSLNDKQYNNMHNVKLWNKILFRNSVEWCDVGSHTKN
jgi:hypothetical protein